MIFFLLLALGINIPACHADVIFDECMEMQELKWQWVDLEMGIYINSLDAEDNLFVWQQMSMQRFAGK